MAGPITSDMLGPCMNWRLELAEVREEGTFWARHQLWCSCNYSLMKTLTCPFPYHHPLHFPIRSSFIASSLPLVDFSFCYFWSWAMRMDTPCSNTAGGRLLQSGQPKAHEKDNHLPWASTIESTLHNYMNSSTFLVVILTICDHACIWSVNRWLNWCA